MARRLLIPFLLVCFLVGAPGTRAASAPAAAWQAAWPMVGHDPQRTNRSAAIVSNHLALLFSHPGVFEQPVVGSDGTIYAWTDAGLAALDLRGAVRWTYPAFPAEGGPPVLAPDGTLYANGLISSEITVPNAAIFGVGADGKLATKLQPSAFSKGSPPAETAEGHLYVPYVGPTETFAGLVSRPSGGPAHLLQHGFTFQSIAIGSNGAIYAVGRYSSHESRISVERLSVTGKVQWRHGIGYDASSLMVGMHGRLYVAGSVAVGSGSVPSVQISCYNTHGRLRWRHTLANGVTELAQRSDGVILAAGQISLVAYSPAGVRLWQVALGKSTLDAIPSIAVDATGTAFVGSGDGLVRIISPDGLLRGTLAAGMATTTGSPQLAIGADGRLIVVGTDDVLRVFG